ncbi:hypothetical protein [Streptomyces peucetius]|uniref:Uncharacterized protein n=1 Tax=Streptomyces peucetius TaxID=1950 RepID=A0ABY6IF74_STRPE|nr:hypothetical protein [Streptomyces peucetius]UYQ65628.1 hypothetical protein OGH68_31990 [Streptomyces peucetius]
MSGLLLERGATLPRKSGTTCSGVAATGTATEWTLQLSGRPALVVHDTRWNNEERDLVLYQPAVVPAIPAALSNLHNRLRVGIARPSGTAALRIMAYTVWVDGERPRIKKSFTTAELADRFGHEQLRSLAARRGVSVRAESGSLEGHACDLKAPQEDERFRHAVHFPAEDDETPVIAFAHLRVIPVLRHVRWLSPAAA